MGRVSLTAQHQLAAVPDPAGLEIPVLQRDPLPLEAGQQLRPAPVQKAGAPHRPGGLQKDPEAVEVPQGGGGGGDPPPPPPDLLPQKLQRYRIPVRRVGVRNYIFR